MSRTLVARERSAGREWKQIELRRTRAEAYKAWQTKDYGKIISLYSAIPHAELTASEVKKLEYARRKLGR